MRELRVRTAEGGMKLLGFLEKHLAPPEGGEEAAPAGDPPPKNARLPHSMLHRWIRSGQVRVNGGRAKAFDRLSPGDTVRVPPFAVRKDAGTGDFAPPRPGEILSPQLRIHAVAGDILVLEKDAGLATQPGSGQASSVADILKARFAGAAYIPAPAHRLDKRVSGLLLAGMSFAAQKNLSALFAGHGDSKNLPEGLPENRAENGPGGMRDGVRDGIRKEYLAWVRGAWPCRGESELRDILVKEAIPAARNVGMRERTLEKVVARAPEDAGQPGKAALSVVRPLRFLRQSPVGPATLMRIVLFTGRTHQIRVQLASRGYPLVGDVKYGGPEWTRPLLHAAALELRPQGQEALRFCSIPPWEPPFTVE